VSSKDKKYLTHCCRIGATSAAEVRELNTKEKQEGRKAHTGLDLACQACFVDTSGAVAKAAAQMTETGEKTEIERIIKENCENEEFWRQVKKEGNGMVIEGNSRAR
jgi:hypothetical protein